MGDGEPHTGAAEGIHSRRAGRVRSVQRRMGTTGSYGGESARRESCGGDGSPEARVDQDRAEAARAGKQRRRGYANDRTACSSDSNDSKTVVSFVIVMTRLLRDDSCRSLTSPPCRRTLRYFPTIIPTPALSM